MKDRFVSTRHGRVHLLEQGEGQPLVLLHSIGCSAYEFEDSFEELSRRFRVIAWDAPGHGDSDPLTAHLKIEDYVDSLVDVLDALELPTAIVGGTSMGGLLTIDLAARFPKRVSKALIVETPLRDDAFWTDKWDFVNGVFAVPVQDFDVVAPRFKKLTPEVHRRWNMDRSKAGGKAMMDAMWAGREYSWQQPLDSLRIPCLVLIGDKGPVYDCVPEYRRRLPKAQVVVMEGCGHFPMLDEPAEFNRIVSEFSAS